MAVLAPSLSQVRSAPSLCPGAPEPFSCGVGAAPQQGLTFPIIAVSGLEIKLFLSESVFWQSDC